jgi:phosphoribosylaminoimidazole-succinocarboxamide synthase
MLTDAQLAAALARPLETAPEAPHLGAPQSGKVRDAWPLPNGRRLLVTTDRVSAFDRVLGTIPFKGQVLNELSAWWFAQTDGIVANHLVKVVDPNAMIVRDAAPLPVEVIVRGFITGVTSTSLWTLYQAGVEKPYGLDLPPGLHKDDRLPSPVITPTTKAGPGEHDARLTTAEIVGGGLLSAELWQQVQEAALGLFRMGQAVAEKAGLLLVDTKYEFGLVDGRLTVIDEIHTPDSSRYWLKRAWEARQTTGKPPEHLDKELLRLALKNMGYGGEGPAPPLPDSLRAQLARKYVELYERLTGLTFQPGGDRPEVPPDARLAARLDDVSTL